MSDYARMVRAILTEDVKNLQKTLSKKGGVNDYDDTGRTPLHIAVMHARTAVIAPLVEAGADPDLTSGDHRTAHELADANGDLMRTTLKEAERSRDAKMAGPAKSAKTVVPNPPVNKSMPISTRAAEAMRARRRSAGLMGDMA